MQKTLLVPALLTAALAFLASQPALGHGGTYRGPGDTVPPGGGVGGGGGGPNGPGPVSGPNGPGSGLGGPLGPGGVAGGQGPGQPDSGAALQADLTGWSFWWEFNKDPFLNLREHVEGGGVMTGDATFFTGTGTIRRGPVSLAPSRADVREIIVPTLIRALEDETANDIVTGAMIALARIGDEPDESGRSIFADRFRPFLRSGSQEIRETAAIALGVLASESSVPDLVGLVRDDDRGRKLAGGSVDTRTRAFAVYGLGLIGHGTAREVLRSEIVAELAAVLEGPVTSVIDIHSAAVIAMGLVSLPVQVEARPAASADLAPDRSRQGQLDFLVGLLGDESKHNLVRAHVPTALARLLAGALDDQDLMTRREPVVRALLATFRRSARAPRELIQSSALALGLLTNCSNDPLDVKARQALLELPKTTSDLQARAFSRIALGSIGGRAEGGDQIAARDEIHAALATGLTRGQNFLRPWSAIGLGLLARGIDEGGQHPIPALGRLLADELVTAGNPERVGACAIAIGIAGYIEGRDELLKRLGNAPGDEARGYVAVALGMLKEREAIVPLQEMLPKLRFRSGLLQQVAIGLGLLGDKSTVQVLVDELDQARSLSSQAALCSALGFIGDKRSVEPLKRLLEDQSKTQRARGFAAVALGLVSDPEKLPWNSKIGVDLNYRASTPTLNDPAGTGILNIL